MASSWKIEHEHFQKNHRDMNSTPCSVCKEGGHREAKCPTLTDPLKPGFHSGGGGGGGHSHDDDDEKAMYPVNPVLSLVMQIRRIRNKLYNVSL
jgi:hypothetical protein